MSGADKLSLKVWLHPSMKMPCKFEAREHPFHVSPTILIVDLMEQCEDVFEQVSKKAGSRLGLQINVLWNIKDHKKALNPNEKVGQHFASGDTFGVYGDIGPMVNQDIKPEEEKIPVTILTGFLGSGKTTLLNYILQEQKDKKIAVIENELGEISIDDALLKNEKLSTAEKIIVMDNGCVCCTIRGDLVHGLKDILEDIHKGGRIDGIMIETTGMADPVPIVKTFMQNPDLTVELRLDAVVAMVDAKHIVARLDDKVEEGKVNEAYQQVAFADKIILNKLDLTTPDAAIAVKDRLRDINTFAKILPAVKGGVKLTELMNIRAHDMINFVNEDIEKEAEVPAELEGGHGDDHGGDGGHDGGHGGGHGQDEEYGGGHGGGHGTVHGTAHGAAHGSAHGEPLEKSRHDSSRVNSFSIIREGEIVPRRLAAWMQNLGSLPREKGTISRIKAILALKGHKFKRVFHAVMDVTDEDDAGPWLEGEKKVSKIVFIGKALDQAFLRQGFEAILDIRRLIGHIARLGRDPCQCQPPLDLSGADMLGVGF